MMTDHYVDSLIESFKHIVEENKQLRARITELDAEVAELRKQDDLTTKIVAVLPVYPKDGSQEEINGYFKAMAAILEVVTKGRR